MKRFLAFVIAMMMLVQTGSSLAEAVTDGTYEAVSEPVGLSMYHIVTFTADGEDVSTIFVVDGAKMESLPEAPVLDGKAFLGWYDQNRAFTVDTIIDQEKEIQAVYKTIDSTLEAKKAAADFHFIQAGDYATVEIFGTHKADQVPSAEKRDQVGGLENIVDAWTVSGLKNDTDLTVEAVVTALPEDGVLSAYSVENDAVFQLAATDLSIGDIVTFDLSMKGADGIAFVIEDTSEENVEVEGTLYANDTLYLSGKVPCNGVIDVQPVTVTIDGEEVLAAYDIRIYASEKQRAKGKTWQPSDQKVTVHFFDEAFTGTLNIYHVENETSEYVTTVEAQDGWVAFEADHFSTYAVTRTLEKTMTIGGNTYHITVAYDQNAGIPKGAELAVEEVSTEEYLAETATVLECGAEDEIFYTKFLDISIMYQGEIIEPKTSVKVTVELLDVEDGAQALEVVHFSDIGAQKVDSQVDEGGVVTFATDSFSIFGFTSVLRALLSWTSDNSSYTLQSFPDLRTAAPQTFAAPQRASLRSRSGCAELDVAVEEGIEVLNAYQVPSTLGDLQNPLYVKVQTVVDLAERESVAVYSVKDGEVVDFLAEGEDVSVCLGNNDSFAVVKDSGYRQKTFELGDVELNGMMPKAAEASAENVTGQYEAFDITHSEGGPEESGDEELPYRIVAAYDISIMDGNNEYQPDEEHPVEVGITCDDLSDHGLLALWHIRDDGSMEPVTAFTVEESTIRFTAAGFSVYVVVEMPEPVVYGDTPEIIADLTSSRGVEGFYLSLYRPIGNNSPIYNTFFVTSTLGNNVLVEDTDQSVAAVWYFEPVEGTTNQFTICTKIGDEKKYIRQVSANNNNITLSDNGTIFVVSIASNGLFEIKHASEERYLQHSGSGGGIRFYTDNKNKPNSQFTLTYASEASAEKDPYGLDGKTYGIMNRKNEISAYGMMSDVVNSGKLAAKEMLIRTDPMNQSNTLYVAKNSDLAMWTFHAIENDLYYLTVNGQYLRIDANGSLTLADEPDEKCQIRVIPGTGSNAGKVCLLGKTTHSSISLADNNTSFSTNANTTSSNAWQNLVEYSVYSEDDFVQYSAHKVSVSDSVNVANGKQVIIYTRVWNETEKKYEFFAIDHNGDVLPCYESGDSLLWIGTQINTLLWNFTEYYRPGTTVPNGYYELQNAYSGNYIAPQINNGQIFKDGTIGINLNGRLYGDYFTSILSWDDSHYDYAGYKVENGKIVSCPMAQADTFYFAVMDLTEHTLTPVDTVDHNALGLTMKMIDCPTREYMSGILGNNDGGMGTTLHQGLLSTEIPGDGAGYPTTSVNRSLSEIYSNAVPVNHLFIRSIYEGSGYFQFDSSENFAELNGSNFTVYRELGAMNGNGPTRTHGQFMPFNTLTGNVNQRNPYNLTDIYGNSLSDNNPRKYEPLFDLGEAEDYHFAMEITGRFMQPPNGHDAWGHDIIFEFVGDDDFWLYVDGELVIDLGGIHSAVPGSVNYSTGDVYVNGTHTTLKDLFYNNYKNRGHSAAEAREYVDGIFQEKTVNGKTCYVFKDYSAHTVRIFYMERGGGASNLRMRFNLATVTPGQVLLTKEIAGTVKQDFASVRFPFQIYYKTEGSETYELLRQEVTSGIDAQWRAVYYNTSTKVDFEDSVTINGVTYDNVFYLKPGQTAAIKFPEHTISYYVKECGVDSSIYDHVYINDVETEGETPSGATVTKIFESSPAAPEERARIAFSNHVDPSQLRTLTITKRLFDASGTEITSEQDDTGFTVRLRLGEELAYYNHGEYYVKDASGNYCRFNPDMQEFESIGVHDFDSLTDEQLLQVTFRTSPSGAASKLPAGHSIEVRGLMVGTRFQVDEEDYDLPIGYGKRVWTEGDTTYNGYKRIEGSYLVDEGDTQNSGTIRDNSNPKIEVHNQRGWGIRADKVWSDADFMLSHDDIYFAVYVNDQLLDGSVHKIDAYNYTTYFFPSLESGASFSDYKVYEVILTDPVTAADGTISYSGIQKVETSDTITINGVRMDGTPETGLSYAPSYAQGSETDLPGESGAMRTDTVTNMRIGGLRIIKTDDQNEALPGAVFILKQNENSLGTFTSAADGLVTTVYLQDGVYTLEEIKTPKGYAAINDSFQITVSNGTFDVRADKSEGFEYNSSSQTLSIRNVPYTLTAMKIDAADHSPLENAHFALYRQVMGSGGQPRKDYYPIEGHEDLVSDADGMIPEITQLLAAGSYYLTETQAPDEYELPEPVNEVLFTIGETGRITVQSGTGYMGWVEQQENACTIMVPNGKTPNADLTIEKIVSGDLGDRTQPFTFTLAAVDGEENGTEYAWVKTAADQTETSGFIHSGETFTLADGEFIVITLPKNKNIELREENQYYTASWKEGSNPIASSSASGHSTVTVSLNTNTTITVENNLKAVAPTDYRANRIPYLLMLLAGSLLLLLRRRHGSKKGGGSFDA